MSPEDDRHGTLAGYIYHRTAGVPSCAECRQAAADYERQRNYDRHLGRPRLIPTLGTIRRIRALQRIGWSMKEIARQGGWRDRDSIYTTLLSEHITTKNAARVADVYDRLCMTVGPSTITASRATRAGWPPPLAWDNIDDPNEVPNAGGCDDEIDEVAIERTLSGDRVPTTRAERVEVVRRWVASGRTIAALERLTGWKVERYYRIKDAS